jgi:hypothetical protein
LPVVISVPELAASGLGVVPYLQERVNAEFGVAIDWGAAAEAGLPELLFDGLDEVSGDRRKAILDQIATFSLRVPDGTVASHGPRCGSACGTYWRGTGRVAAS